MNLKEDHNNIVSYTHSYLRWSFKHKELSSGYNQIKLRLLELDQSVVLAGYPQLSHATSECTPVYIYSYPWNEAYMTYVSS